MKRKNKKGKGKGWFNDRYEHALVGMGYSPRSRRTSISKGRIDEDDIRATMNVVQELKQYQIYTKNTIRDESYDLALEYLTDIQERFRFLQEKDRISDEYASKNKVLAKEIKEHIKNENVWNEWGELNVYLDNKLSKLWGNINELPQKISLED